MPRATLNGIALAESGQAVIVEGNHHSPPGSLSRGLFREGDATSYCPWKGEAGHLTFEVGGVRVEEASWYYPEPMQAAENIRDRVAFYGDKAEVGR